VLGAQGVGVRQESHSTSLSNSTRERKDIAIIRVYGNGIGQAADTDWVRCTKPSGGNPGPPVPSQKPSFVIALGLPLGFVGAAQSGRALTVTKA
jgi:hypothetical protein